MIDGGAGFDYAYFSADRSRYDVTTLANGVTVVDYLGSGGDGTDRLINVEALVFADDTFYL